MWINALHIYMAHSKVSKYSDLLKGEPAKVQEKLIEFVRYRKSKVRVQSVSVQLTGIRHFYYINSFKGLSWALFLVGMIATAIFIYFQASKIVGN